MADHRPLSDWVSEIPIDGHGVGKWNRSLEINDGDERTDARRLPKFIKGGWVRRAIPLEEGLVTLGLVEIQTGRTIIELNDLALPIPISPKGLAVIDRFEETWPDVRVATGDIQTLANESISLRYHLLSRLAAERKNPPPPDLFHILPWELVERISREIVLALRKQGPASSIAMYHWFVPVGSHFSGALEQLNEGLREQELEVVRTASTALCIQLLYLNQERVPTAAREALQYLLLSLPAVNPLLQHAANGAWQRLSGQVPESSVGHLPYRLAPVGGQEEMRVQIERLQRGPLVLEFRRTDQGLLSITALASLIPSDIERIIAGYGVVLVRVTVRIGEKEFPILIPLAPLADGLMGSLEIRLPAGEDAEVTADDAPIGAKEARSLTVDEVKRSLAGADRTATQNWRRLADLLPDTSAVHRALADLDSEEER